MPTSARGGASAPASRLDARLLAQAPRLRRLAVRSRTEVFQQRFHVTLQPPTTCLEHDSYVEHNTKKEETGSAVAGQRPPATISYYYLL